MEVGTLIVAALAFFGLAGTGIGVWVSLRERLVRAETRIEMLQQQHAEFKGEFRDLREWLEDQFHGLRNQLQKKVDR